MKNKLKLASIIAVAAVITSCSTTVPLTISDAPIGTKKGSSSTVLILGFQLNPNFGIAEAANKGKITGAVAYADIKITNYVFFVKKEIIINGN